MHKWNGILDNKMRLNTLISISMLFSMKNKKSVFHRNEIVMKPFGFLRPSVWAFAIKVFNFLGCM